MSTTTYFGTINHHVCGECGVTFGLESHFDDCRRADGKSFYCPNGHSLLYRETATQRAEKAARRAQELLEMERRRHEQTRAELNTTERRRRAEAGAKTKLKKRAAAGVCPCCTRSFANVQRHMASQHPEFVAEAKIETNT